MNDFEKEDKDELRHTASLSRCITFLENAGVSVKGMGGYGPGYRIDLENEKDRKHADELLAEYDWTEPTAEDLKRSRAKLATNKPLVKAIGAAIKKQVPTFSRTKFMRDLLTAFEEYDNVKSDSVDDRSVRDGNHRSR